MKKKANKGRKTIKVQTEKKIDDVLFLKKERKKEDDKKSSLKKYWF